MGYSNSLRVAVALAVLVFGSGAAWAQQAPTGTWSSSPLSGNGSISGDTYYYGGSASEGTYLYVVGGYHPGQAPYNSGPNYYRRCRRFDPVNNSWANMADIPNGGSYYGGGTCFYSDGVTPYIFIFGNYDPWYGYTGYTYRYSISGNSWSQLSNLPNNNYYVGASALGNRIYIAGGGASQTAFYEFDPANNSFTSRPNMPTGRYLLTATGINSLNRLYAIGGYGNGYMATVEAYEPPSQAYANGRWMSGTAGNDPLEHDPQDMNTPNADGTPGSPAQRYMAKSVTVGTRVYVVGGYSNSGYMNTMLEFNPNASQTAPGGNQWRQRANMAGTRGYYPAAGVITTASGPKVVAYGGLSNSTTGEIYTPPDFGTGPNAPTALAQIGSSAASSLQALADATDTAGWTNNQIQFTGTLTDPDMITGVPQQVRFRVQVKPQSASWTSNQVTNLQTNLGAQGVHTLSYNIPADGGFDWRWRIEDSYSNSFPTQVGAWVEAFGDLLNPNTTSPDFRSDQIAPADPLANQPSNIDIQVPDPVLGDVVLTWTESTDNGPVSGISYEIQVATEGGFLDIEAQLFSPAGTSSYPVTLTVSRYDKFWRIRARDIGGNLSNWSPDKHFRVTYNDGINHSEGDAKKTCGMTASAVPALGTAILGLAILGLASLRRMRK